MEAKPDRQLKVGLALLAVLVGAAETGGSRDAHRPRLLDADKRVRTLTNSPQRRNPFAGAVEAHPYN